MILGSILLLFLIISPVLASGYFSDDTMNSLMPGTMAELQTNPISFAASIIHSWMTTWGRFYPLSYLWGYSFFYLVSSLFLYKLFLIFAVLINVALFAYSLKLVTKRNIIAIFSILVIPIFLKITLSPNPITSSWGLMQSVFLFILLSLITLVFYIEKNAKYYLILSMVFYFIGLMIYEVSYPLFILHIVLVFSLYRHKPLLYKIKTSLLIFLVALITFGITIAIRVYYGFPILPVNGGLYSLTFSISGFFKSMPKDISAVIPLSYTFLDPHKIFGSYDALFYNTSSAFAFVYRGRQSYFILCYFHEYVGESNINESEQKKSDRYCFIRNFSHRSTSGSDLYVF